MLDNAVGQPSFKATSKMVDKSKNQDSPSDHPVTKHRWNAPISGRSFSFEKPSTRIDARHGAQMRLFFS